MVRIILFFIIAIILSGNFPILNAKSYKGAEYRTNESFVYGRFEVRYKPANREGVVSSFFTYHDFDNTTGWNEIDFEFIGRYENTIQFNAITPGQQFHIRSQVIDFDAYADFHNYAFEWTPDYVAWFIDGEEVYRQTGEHISTLQYPQKIMMNIWNPVFTNWVGYFDDVFLPAVSIYDYVSYSSYTPGTGNYGTGNNFTFEWKDDFDNYDDVKWSKASHTFSGNMADFDPENIIFQDGYLHLYLTDEDFKTGIDNVAPQIMWAMANYDSSITLKLSEEITIESGENISNYLLPGSIITSAKLSENKLFVTLTTENYNPYQLMNLIYSKLVDLSSNNNSTPTKVVQLNNVDSISFPIKVNVGGGEYLNYLPDQEWNSSVQYGYLMGDANSSHNIDFIGTDDDEVFETERKGLVSYKFKVPNGLYDVALSFAANSQNTTWNGIFNAYAENKIIESNINLISDVGYDNVYTANSQIEVYDGILDLNFEEVIDSAFVNAIEINKIVTGVNSSNNSKIINQIELNQNYPNPFNPTTVLSFNIPEKSHIKLNIYDNIGNKISTLVNSNMDIGLHEINFNASNLSSGIYYYQLASNDKKIATKKMVLLK
ncbi:MAG: family 16 glycosylhydrolase [Ignavibacteriales bacterium]|nr:family 16 glycosylhydrolase [Ignavibacteriales bacterium]